MPKAAPIHIRNDRSKATVSRHGAQVLSWTHEGKERLFTSPLANFTPGHPIRGGVPVIFPQFSDRGPGLRHGFARTRLWERENNEEKDCRSIELHLRQTAETLATWPHDFEARLAVTVDTDSLSVSLSIRNTSRGPFTFTCALHTYLLVDEISRSWIEGLHGIAYQDATKGDSWSVQDEPSLRFDGEVDRVYRDCTGPLVLASPASKIRIEQQGFRDTVVWNPGADQAARMADLGPDGHRRFVCIEAGSIHHPVEIGPGSGWNGSQTLIV